MARIAVCWTTSGGNMSRIHIGDRRTGHTLCGEDKSGTYGPYWMEVGRPAAPGTLTTLGEDRAEVSCQRCWNLHQALKAEE